MVQLIFDTDFKSACRILFLLRKSWKKSVFSSPELPERPWKYGGIYFDHWSWVKKISTTTSVIIMTWPIRGIFHPKKNSRLLSVVRYTGLVCWAHVFCVMCFFVFCVEIFWSSNTKTVSFGSFWTLIRISAIREQTSLVLQKNLILDSEILKPYEKFIENTFFWGIFSVVFLALKNRKMVFSSKKIDKNSFFRP